MVLAVLLAFLLGRPVAWLERRKVGRVSSVLLVVTVAFLVIGGLGYVVGNQVVGLANNLGNYQDEIKKKVISLRGTGSDVGRTFEKLSHDLRNASWVATGRRYSAKRYHRSFPRPRRAATCGTQSISH